METLLDWLNTRTLTAAAVLAAVVCLGVKFQHHPRIFYQHWRYTAQNEKTPLATEIERDLDARGTLKLRALHREVSMEISKAVADGFDVGTLQENADALLQFDTTALRPQAVDRLQKLRLSIPRRTPKFLVANEEDEPETAAVPRSRSVGRARTRKR